MAGGGAGLRCGADCRNRNPLAAGVRSGSVGLAGVWRLHLASDGARRGRPWVAPARLWGPALAAMGLLPLLVLAVLALEPGAASGAETVGNSSEGKVGGASLLRPKVGFAFLARSVSAPQSVRLAGEVVSSEVTRMDQNPFLQKASPIAKEALPSTSFLRLGKWDEMGKSLVQTH